MLSNRPSSESEFERAQDTAQDTPPAKKTRGPRVSRVSKHLHVLVVRLKGWFLTNRFRRARDVGQENCDATAKRLRARPAPIGAIAVFIRPPRDCAGLGRGNAGQVLVNNGLIMLTKSTYIVSSASRPSKGAWPPWSLGSGASREPTCPKQLSGPLNLWYPVRR